MSGPWERYRAQAPAAAPSGPWLRYQQQAQDAIPPPPPQAPPVPPASGGMLDDIGRSIAQGASFGFADEIAAGGDALLGHLVGRGSQAGSISERYQQNLATERARDAATPGAVAIPGQIAGGVAGSIATTPAMLLRGATSGLNALARLAGFGVAQGAVAGFGGAEGGVENRLAGAGTGAAIGGVAGAAGGALGQIIAPQVSPQVRALANQGVEMTPGQILGGPLRVTENALSSVPIAGSAVTSAQRRSIEGFNRAAANRVLAPLGDRLPRNAPVGRQMIEGLSERIDDAYGAAISRVRSVSPDQQFASDIADVGRSFLTPETADSFQRIVRDRVLSRLTGEVDGATYKTIDSELGRFAAQYRSSAGAAEREMGEALGRMQTAFRGLMARQNPEASDLFRRADAAYAHFLRVQAAAAGPGALEGVFSPAQLGAAVRATDRSGRHRAFAAGNALMQDLSDAGRAVLPSTVNDSGTATRAMHASGLGALVAGGVGAINPGVAAAVAGGTLGYSAPVNRLTNWAILAQRPAPVQVGANALSRFLGPASVPATLEAVRPPQ